MKQQIRPSARVSLLGLAGFLAAGCAIPFEDASDTQLNTCEESDDCGAGFVCASVGASEPMCLSTAADLSGVVFEIRPAAGAKFGANTSHLIDPVDQGVHLHGQLGGPITFDPHLPALVSISPGTVQCIADKSSVPAKVEFKHVASFVGIPEKPYTTTSELDPPQGGASPSFSFHLDVPPGVYDIYIEPESPVTCGGAPLPPVFIPGRLISVDSTFRLDLEPARHLTGEIALPPEMSVDGWLVDVVEVTTGRLISSTQELEHKAPGTPALIDLHYNLTQGVTPIIRLRPPSGVIAPTVFWDLAAADLQGKNVVKLAITDLATTLREVEGHVLDTQELPVIASVTLQSAGLSGAASQNAAYMVVVETDANGLFKASVPPGQYRVIATPLNDETKAIAEASWPIGAESLTCFCGQVVTVPDRATLQATVVTPAGGPLLSANVVASPSLPAPITQLSRELGLAPTLPREASTMVTDGQFSLGVDFGFEAFDVSVQPPPVSGYPWLVRSQLAVQPMGDSGLSSLGTITVANPVVVTGTIRDPFGNVVPDASLRVWLPVKDSSGVTGTVVQIADTSTDASGRYTLLLPPSIAQ